jgi:hypothetical protein
MDYLAPFLEVIRSPETSGPITGVALTSVRRILEYNMLGGALPFSPKYRPSRTAGTLGKGLERADVHYYSCT